MIIPMKKAELIILKSDRKKVLEAVQRGSELMIIPPEEEASNQKAVERERIRKEQAQAGLSMIDQVAKKNGFIVDRPAISYEDFMKENKKGRKAAKKAEKIAVDRQAAQTRIQQAESENLELAPWRELGEPTSALKDSRHVTVRTGFTPSNAQEDLKAVLGELPCEVQFYGNAPEGIATVIFAYETPEITVIDRAKESGFNEASIIQTYVPPEKAYQDNLFLIEDNKMEIERLDRELEKLAKKRDDLELLVQQLASSEARESVPYSDTVETVRILGWVREDRTEKLESEIHSATDVYDLQFSDPAEGELAPTVTQNPEFLASFETITEMFSLPKPGAIDPAPLAGPWYWVIFGMMVGDVGYGVVSVIAFWLFRKLRDPRGSFRQLINVLYYSSYMTIFWGIMFGSYFGETWHPIIFSPLDDPMTMLIFTMVVGVLHVFCGMGMKFAEDVKAGKTLDGILDEISWMVLITGIGLMFISKTAKVGQWMAIIGALVILFTAGRHNKGFGKVTGGILGLYNITGYLSDILSYSRILALALATSVVGMVMNLLAGMVSGSALGMIAAVLILLVGHVFNIAMSTLSAYVHDSRLEYIEFFNQFYEGGGKPFRPLALSEQYYDVKDAVYPLTSDQVGPEHLDKTNE